MRRYDLGELLAILRRQKKTIALITLVLVSLTLLYVVSATRLFTAQSVVLIDPRRLQIFRQDSVTADPIFDSASIESQLETLKSEQVMLAVIKNLKLNQDPEFIGPSSDPIGVVFRYIASILGQEGDNSEDSRNRKAVGKFKDKLDAKRVGLSYAISINFTSESPTKAAAIANELAEAFMVDQLESKFQLTQRAGSWLQTRIRELQNQASEAERVMLEFKSFNQIVDANGRLVNEQQLQESNTQLSVARANTADAKARLDRIREVVGSGIPDATIADALKSDVLTKMRIDYLEKAKTAADFGQRFGQSHQATLQLRSDMKRIELGMMDELRRIEQAIQSEYEINKAREESVQKDIVTLNSKWADTRQAQVKLKELESAATSYRALHDTFVQRYLLAVQQQSFPISDARVITYATKPDRASWPKSFLFLAAAMFVGLGLGCMIALARELLDQRVRSARQVEDATSAEFLGILPEERSKALQDQSAFVAQIGRSPMLDQQDRVFSMLKARPALWRVLRQPFSVYSETIRKIAVSVDMARMSRDIRSISIVSSNSGEGKTTTTINLALSIARAGKRVLVIDADLRNPQLTRMLTPDASKGLLEVLTGTASVADVLWQDEATGVYVLPTVLVSKPKDTARFLASEAMRLLLEKTTQHFDYIILDTAPAGPVVDVRAFAHLIDSFVLVAAWGETARGELESVAGAEFIRSKLLGTVLTKVNLRSYRLFEPYHENYFNEDADLKAA